MACKIFILAALVAVAQAGVVAPAAPVVAAKVLDTEYDPNPQYTYAYDVQDSLTGDSKNQFETRNGDVVQGRYSLIEADGTRRIVDYTADPINGFNAVVQREPAVVKAAVVAPVAKLAAPVVAPAPVARYFAPAPVAPVAKYVAAPAPVLASPYAKFVAAPAPVVASPFAKFVAAPAPVVASPFAKFVAAPAPVAKYFAPAPVAPVARFVAAPAPLAAPLVGPAPIAKIAAPLSYPAPFAKVVSPFGYSAAYSTYV